jgi:N-acyl-D-amino-acid deacylase
MLNLLIVNGMIIDGTGSPGYYAAVGVDGETVRIIRGDASSLEAARTIDATDHVVCPGFIDVHAHSALMILAEPRHEPKIRQGVTTELIGIDGNSYAPFRSNDDLLAFIKLNAGLEGTPPLPGTWSTVEQYLAMFDKNVPVNIAYILGNSPVRIGAIGWDNVPATGADLANMKAIIRESMEEGAFGMSTGLDYPPGNYADTDELVELSRQVADLGGIYHSHLRYKLGDRFLDPIREAIEIGRRSGVPIHITHVAQRNSFPGGSKEMLRPIEDAHELGLDVTFDSVPLYPGSTRLIIMFPDWAHEGGPENLIEVLRSEEHRERLRQEVGPSGSSWQDMWLTYFKRPENQKYEGVSISELAIMRGKHPVDAMCDLLLEEDLQTSYNAMAANLKSLPSLVAHPLSMVGSDALLLGDNPPPRSYGTFPAILGEYVREEKHMDLPTGIRKMTSFPAQRLGIPDRGILRDGMKADITVFHPKEVKAMATRTNPRQFPTGIPYVIVNGTVVIDDGNHTGATPGRALKHGRPTR